MKAKDLKAQNPEELIQKEKELKKELYDLNYQRKLGQVEKPGRFRVIKRDIARILTVLNEKEREEKNVGKNQ